MPTIYDAHPSETIEKAAELLKKDVKMPQWGLFVKTSPGKQNPPDREDWYYQRAASVLHKVYRFGPIGTNKLKVKYGTKKNRGHAKERFAEGSGKIIRTILQQLEIAGYIKKEKKGSHSGRTITPKGKSFLDKCVMKHGTRQKSGRAAQPAPGPAEAGAVSQAS